MKSRIGFVSNSSSSSFVFKKSEIDLDQLREFLKKTNNKYQIMTDDESSCEDIKDALSNGIQIVDEYAWVSTMSDRNDYCRDHLLLLSYMKKYNIKDYSSELNIYSGDGRDDEYCLAEGDVNSDEIQKWFRE